MPSIRKKPAIVEETRISGSGNSRPNAWSCAAAVDEEGSSIKPMSVTGLWRRFDLAYEGRSRRLLEELLSAYGFCSADRDAFIAAIESEFEAGSAPDQGSQAASPSARLIGCDYIHRTSLGKHERGTFSCGVAALDDWFHLRAGQDEKRNVARIFVAIDDRPGAVGFYSLSTFALTIPRSPNRACQTSSSGTTLFRPRAPCPRSTCSRPRRWRLVAVRRRSARTLSCEIARCLRNRRRGERRTGGGFLSQLWISCPFRTVRLDCSCRWRTR